MDVQTLLSATAKLRDLKAKVRESLQGFHLRDGDIMSIVDRDQRLAIIAESWKIENAAQALQNPTTTYEGMAKASQEIIGACNQIVCLALQWGNAELEMAGRRLEDRSDEVGELVFDSELWEELKPDM